MSIAERNRPRALGAVPAVTTTATVLYGVDQTLTVFPRPENVVASSAPESNFAALDARPSWPGVVAIQYVGDRNLAAAVARAAGRRTVEKFGEALERLAD